MKQEKETLTKGEFDVMSKLWDINHSASTRDIMERFGEPKPAYSTIATYMKKLVDKEFADYYKVKGGGKTKKNDERVYNAPTECVDRCGEAGGRCRRTHIPLSL